VKREGHSAAAPLARAAPPLPSGARSAARAVGRAQRRLLGLKGQNRIAQGKHSAALGWPPVLDTER